MRADLTLFETFGLVAVLPGHSADGDGLRGHCVDVGVVGGGLRADRWLSPSFVERPASNRWHHSPHRCWTADANEPELWVPMASGPRLLGAGEHHAQPEITLERVQGTGPVAAWLLMAPIQVLPVLDGTVPASAHRDTFLPRYRAPDAACPAPSAGASAQPGFRLSSAMIVRLRPADLAA